MDLLVSKSLLEVKFLPDLVGSALLGAHRTVLEPGVNLRLRVSIRAAVSLLSVATVV